MRRSLITAVVAVAALMLPSGVAAAVPGDPVDPPEDTTPPLITITRPANGAIYEKGIPVSVAFACVDPHPQDCTGTFPNGAALPTGQTGVFSFTVDAEDSFGNTSSRTNTYEVRDTRPPLASILSPGDGASYARGSVVGASFSCSDPGGGPVNCQGTVGNGQAIDTSTLGTKTFTLVATDSVGLQTRVSRSYTVVDRTDPTVTITTPAHSAEIERGSTVLADYACADETGGSGLASCTGDVANGTAINTTTLGAHTFTVTAVDNAGNSRARIHPYTVVDGTDPTVSISTPVDGGRVVRGGSLTADFACADEVGGSGLASCTGTVADGAAVPTGAVGSFTFSVTAVDGEGNTTVETVGYEVVAPRCAGRAVTVMLALGDRPTARADVILGTPTRDVVDGRGGADVLCGLAGDDGLTGGAGADLLDGGTGRDRLVGGTQRDTCRGGPQRDTHSGCEVRTGLP